VVAQLTLPSAFSGSATMGVSGRTTSGATWREDAVRFAL
jgi:hypothetical protein